MKKYKYTAVNIDKRHFSGTFFAESEEHLRQQLATQNLYLISARVTKDVAPNSFFSMSGKISNAELTTFCRQFAIMLNSGISILESLYQLKEQKYTAIMKQTLNMIYDDVKIGVLLSSALEKYKKLFPDFFRSMIYVGEVSGNLEEVLVSLADYYENEGALKRKVKSALAYPIMMGAMLVGMVVLMLFMVVPRFQGTLSAIEGVDMKSGLTGIVFGLSDWAHANWKTLLTVIASVVGFVFLFLKTKKGKFLFDEFKYRCPGINNVAIDMVASKFTKSMSLLLSSGMTMVDALDVVGGLLGNRYAEAEFKHVIEDVRQGASLTFAMEMYKLFPQLLIQMVATGEKTGNVEGLLKKIVKFFDEQVEASLMKLTGFLQPMMMGLLGVVVGGMFLAIYSPMISMMSVKY